MTELAPSALSISKAGYLYIVNESKTYSELRERQSRVRQENLPPYLLR